uniref:CID domain-containing protein n=1 Tax=Heterorhabditis bacteriophora TaxID=37862 RepID=A0A1I7XV35_HETBA
MIKNATVRVVIPTDSQLLSLIHRTIEFVIREGPLFEAMLMARESGNPIFRMFEDGSWWEPPVLLADLFKCMPKSLYHHACTIAEPEKWFPVVRKEPVKRKRTHCGSDDEAQERDKRKKNYLSGRERDEFEQLLRDLIPEKDKIGDAMLWCAEHATCAKEICECIYESLTIDETPLHKKIARVYLISDILANCAQRGVRDVFYFRQYFGELLNKVFEALGRTLQKVDARLKAEQFKQRIMNCFRAWEDNAIYPTDVLIHNQNVFLGLVQLEDGAKSENDDDIDGAPIEDIDGMPLDDESIFESDEEEDKAIMARDEPPKKQEDSKLVHGVL